MLNINTGLNGFRLVDRITRIDADHINGRSVFSSASPYLGIEALAQLGALHIRYLNDFQKSVFLLKIAECRLVPWTLLDGGHILSGRMTGQSSAAASHHLKLVKEDQVLMEGEFMFGIRDYDEQFRRHILEPHYRERFSCLLSESKAD